VRYTRAATEGLAALGAPVASQVQQAARAMAYRLADGGDFKRLSGHPTLGRVKAGDFRAIFRPNAAMWTIGVDPASRGWWRWR
jgi:mRNA-degrading endonuclease RelE of RelBE toxin-antitoxin system